MRGFMYILLCANGQYYTGSTKCLARRIRQHNNGRGANYTRKYGTVKLVYYEEYFRIEKAYYRERQIHNWSHDKKEALIRGDIAYLKAAAKKVFKKKRN